MTWLDKLEKKNAREAREKQMAMDYANDMAFDDVMKKYGLVSKKVLYRALAEYDIPTRPRKVNTGIEFKKPEMDKSARAEMREIAERLGCGYYRMECL
jgi:transposase